MSHDALWVLHARCRRPAVVALLGLVGELPWPPEMFFPRREPGEVNFGTDAKAMCARCPVVTDCLSAALARSEEHGIWGGCAIRGPVGRRLKRLSRTSLHGVAVVGDGCTFCQAVDRHRRELRRAFDADGRLVHGRWEAYVHGPCRCTPCAVAWRRWELARVEVAG